MDKFLVSIVKHVFSELGSGYKENVYQKALEIELQRANVTFQSEVICPVIYKNVQVGYERADVVLEYENANYVLELKSQTSSISKREVIQLYKYLNNFKTSTGYIINFIITSDLIGKTIDDYKHVEIFKLCDNKLQKFCHGTDCYLNCNII
jgi:GxxExxY protein